MTSSPHDLYKLGYFHVLHLFLQKLIKKKFLIILKKIIGLFSETWKYKTGIASNRLLECNGEFVLKFCTHCPSRYGNLIYLKNNNIYLKVSRKLEWSRNKVAVGEPVAGLKLRKFFILLFQKN